MQTGNSPSRAHRLVVTMLTTGVATLLAFAINFLLTPYITERLGVEAYGFITLANTFVSYAMIAMTALNSFSTRFIAVEYQRGDKKAASTYFTSLFFANAAVSLVIFLCMLPVIANIDGVLDVPARLVSDVQYLFVLVFVNFLVTNGSNSFSSAAYTKNRLDIYGLFQVASYVVEAVILVALYAVFDAHAYFYGLGLLAAGLVLFAGNMCIYRRLTPDIKLRPSLFSLGAMKTLFVNGIWNSINNLGNVLISGIDLLLANVLLSAVAMGQLSLSRTFSSVFSRLYQLVSQAFQPLFLESYSSDNREALLSRLKLSSKMSGYFASLIFAGFFALGIPFFELWIPGQDISLVYSLTMIGIVGSFFEGLVNPLYYIYTLTLKNKVPTAITVIGGVVSVIGTVVLLEFTDLGVFGCAITTTAVTSLIAIVTNPLYMTHVLGISHMTFYPTFARSFLACVLMSFSFSAVSCLAAPVNWASFILCVLLCGVLSAPIYILAALNRNERYSVALMLRKKYSERNS